MERVKQVVVSCLSPVSLLSKTCIAVYRCTSAMPQAIRLPDVSPGSRAFVALPDEPSDPPKYHERHNQFSALQWPPIARTQYVWIDSIRWLLCWCQAGRKEATEDDVAKAILYQGKLIAAHGGAYLSGGIPD
jgi:hypothetical protein